VTSNRITPATGGPTLNDFTGDSFLRRAGRQLVVTIYGAMRVIRLYPP
jgi:hypothetical protein